MVHEDRRTEPKPEELDPSARIALLEKKLGDLTNAFARTETTLPVYRRKSVLGGFFAVLAILSVWFSTHFTEDPEIPRLVHKNILLSDKALALILERGRTTNNSPLNQEVAAEFHHNIEHNNVTQSHLYAIVNRDSVRTYSNSRIYVEHQIPIGSLRCLMHADPALKAIFLAASAREFEAMAPSQEMEAKISSGLGIFSDCDSPSGAGALVMIPFTDFTPTTVPFFAKTGDEVLLSLHIDARRIDPNMDIVTLAEGHDLLVEAVLFPNTEIQFSNSVRDNHLEARIIIPKGRLDHYVTVSLTEKGAEKVSPTPNAEIDGTRGKTFIIQIIATVTVRPSWEGAVQ